MSDTQSASDFSDKSYMLYKTKILTRMTTFDLSVSQKNVLQFCQKHIGEVVDIQENALASTY